MIDIQAVKDKHRLEDVIEEEGVPLRKEGANLVARCPFHPSDDTPSFTVYPRTQTYFCFACQAWGDAIDFVKRAHNLTFREAVAYLEGHAPTAPRPPALLTPPPTQAITGDHLKILDKVVTHYQLGLEEHPPALRYVLGRGLTFESIKADRVGYSGLAGLGWTLPPAQRLLARELGLLNDRGNERMWKRLTFPVYKQGRPVWLIGRALDDRPPKYLGLPIPKPLMGEDSLEGSNEAWVVEGVIDLLLLRQMARELGRAIPAVALLGTHHSRQVAMALADKARVYLCLDADDAGQRAMDSLAAELGERAVKIELPWGAKDIGDLLPSEVKDLVLANHLADRKGVCVGKAN